MKVEIKPSVAVGTVEAPSSKSMGHRLLICAGLSQGESIIENVSYSQDILATLDCLESMGAVIERQQSSVKIRGVSPFAAKKSVYPCRESGSTLRFFIPIAMLSTCESTFTGYGRLMERPMSVYEKISEEKGIPYMKRNEGITVGGKLTSGIYRVSADISSQFVSGLLFALPLCDGDSEILLEGAIESRSYIDMTIDAMKSFGVTAEWKNESTLFIKGNQQYTAKSLTVEGDYSNAAFPDALNLVGGDVKVKGLKKNSLQGDSVYKHCFELLKKGTPTIDIRNCPDLAPVLMAAASELNGAVLLNTKRLKIKESDRGQVMKQELSKFGADITVNENDIVIRKSRLFAPCQSLHSHNDHRVVMSLAVLCSKYGGVIEDAQAVEKSYPDFFEKLRQLGLEVIENDY